MSTPSTPDIKEEIGIRLNDIIEISAPTNSKINGHIFVITYLDSDNMTIIDESTLEEIHLSINKEGQLNDESIESITILNRDEKHGYARQHNLVPNKWIDIYFSGDVPLTITGEITDLEEDMKEIIKNTDSEKSKKTIESLKLINKKWCSNNQTYNILKYDHSVLLHELREKTGLVRSIIINDKREIVSFSPPKSILFSNFIERYTFEECIAEAFIEGTMINLFFDKNQGEDGEWEIATRSTVGGKISYYIKHDGNKNHTFRSMFLEICNYVNLEFDMLNKDYCYSFVIQHPDNRIVSIIRRSALYRKG